MRSVSLNFLQAAFASETGEGAIVLVTIAHSSLTEPIRVAHWDVNVPSRGETFVAFPFRVTLPNDSEEAAPRARLTIDNVDRQIVLAIRNAQGDPPTVTVEVVLSGTPDVVEAAFPNFELRNVSYDSLIVEGEITLDVLTAEPYPAGRFTPATFPGVH